MSLDTITLFNACQHSNRVLSVPLGITAIVGGNGSGKTNTLGLVKASLLNTYRHLNGSKTDNVRRGISNKAMSFIQTDWTVAEGNLQIRRGLKNCSSHLLLNDSANINGRVITKESEITDTALRLLGFDKAAVSNFLFADFKELAEIIDGDKMSRASMLGNLCGLSQVVDIEKLLAKELTVASAKLGEFSEDELITARIDWKSTRDSRRNLFKKLNLLNEELSKLGDIEQIERAVYDREKAVQQRELLLDELRRERDKRRKLKQRLRQNKNSMKQLTVVIGKLTHTDRLIDQSIRRLRKRTIASVLSQEAIDNLPVELEHTTLLNAASDVKASKLTFERKQSKVRYRIDHAKSACETCGTLLDMSDNQLQETKDNLEAEVAVFRNLMREIDNEVLAARKNEADKLNNLSTVRTKIYGLRQRVEKKSAWGEQAVTTLAEANVTIKKLEADLGEIPKTSTVSSEAKKKLAKLRILHQKKLELTAAIKSNATTLGMVLPRYRMMRRKKRKHEKHIEWLNIVRDSRSVCHRDRLQLTVIKMVAAPLVQVMNQFLADLSMPFRTLLDVENFAFTVDHGGGETEAAARLSHGQKLAFGVAFWLARARVFQQELPIFFLDEPSANLDATNELVFSNFVSKLSTQLENEGKQGVIITHSQAVANGASTLHKLTSMDD